MKKKKKREKLYLLPVHIVVTLLTKNYELDKTEWILFCVQFQFGKMILKNCKGKTGKRFTNYKTERISNVGLFIFLKDTK